MLWGANDRTDVNHIHSRRPSNRSPFPAEQSAHAVSLHRRSNYMISQCQGNARENEGHIQTRVSHATFATPYQEQQACGKKASDDGKMRVERTLTVHKYNHCGIQCGGRVSPLDRIVATSPQYWLARIECRSARSVATTLYVSHVPPAQHVPLRQGSDYSPSP